MGLRFIVHSVHITAETGWFHKHYRQNQILHILGASFSYYVEGEHISFPVGNMTFDVLNMMR